MPKYKVSRTEVITDYQIVEAKDENDALFKCKDDEWRGEDVVSSNSEVEEVGTGIVSLTSNSIEDDTIEEGEMDFVEGGL